MNRLLPFVLCLLCVGPGFAEDDEIVLAHVGGEPVTSAQLERQFSERHSGHTMFLLGDAEIRRFLDQVVDDRLLVQEAYRLELDRDPEIVAAVDDFRTQRAAERLVDEEVDSAVSVSDEEVRGIWENQLNKVRDVLEIVVATETEAEQVVARLARGEEFEAVAREVSIAHSRLRGGQLPPVGWGAGDADWERSLFSLEPGQTSAPFDADAGWTILRLLAVREVERPEFDKVQDRVRALLARRKLEARREQFRDQLWTKYSARLVAGRELEPAALKALLASSPDAPLATWKGGELGVAAFVEGLDLGQISTRPDAVAFVGDLLERTVNGALADLEAKERGIDQLPEIEHRAVEVRELLMLGKLLSEHLLRGVSVSDEDVRAWYEEHRDELRVAERKRTAQIVVGSRQEAEALRSRLEAGEDFGRLAEEASLDRSSARAGGDLGWISVAEIPAAMAAVRELRVGAVSEPIETRYGWHLIRVTAIEPSRPRSFEEVADDLRGRLLERRKTERRAQWIAKLREATEIVVDDAAIAEFARVSAQAAAEPPAPRSATGDGDPEP